MSENEMTKKTIESVELEEVLIGVNPPSSTTKFTLSQTRLWPTTVDMLNILIPKEFIWEGL